MKRLLAKSTTSPEAPEGAATLVGHTQLVVAAAETLLERVGTPSLDAVGLPRSELPRLERLVRLAAFVHDLGKCSVAFQEMVRGAAQPQPFRHEAISLWLAWPRERSPLGSWLTAAAGGDELDLKLALVAAAGHHRKFPAGAVNDAGSLTLRLLSDHADFQALLALGAQRLGLAAPPVLGALSLDGASGSADRMELDVLFPMSLGELTATDQRLLALSKTLLINADIAGSALPRTEVGVRWLPTALELRNSQSLDRLVERRLGQRSLRPFQERVAASTAPVTLVRAGCGSGKTLAAWLWGARQHPRRQFWLCYPTTGTTTEGYRDYVQGADLHAFIEHGRAAVDVEFFGLREGDDDAAVLRDADRLRAVRQWGAEAITCTVDTAIGLLQNQRKGLYAWPGLSRGAMVFDEIHAYDERLFSLLLSWLEALPGLPALLMTASLPADRLEALQRVVSAVHGRPLEIIDGPEELEALPRYRRTEGPVDEVVERVLADGGKVLWVSNTVKRCCAVRRRAAWAQDAKVYHSRFRYLDRVARHRDVVDAFARSGAALATATQVAEMSLDLSADLLVMELAPVPAMIQRLGRLNRRSTPEHPFAPRPFVVLEPDRPEPYSAQELEEARQWLSRLGARELSQRDLVAAWVSPVLPQKGKRGCAWLGDPYVTVPDAVRDASPGVTVVLQEDAERVKRNELDVAAVALPLGPPPRSVVLSRLARVAYQPVVPPDLVTYDEMEGATWR